MVKAIITVMERQLADHLPGGKFNQPSDNLNEEAKSCPLNNISGEQVFAIWDARYRKAKSAHIDKTSNKTTFKMKLKLKKISWMKFKIVKKLKFLKQQRKRIEKIVLITE